MFRSEILNFNNIIGNESVKHLLDNSVKSNNLVHSYIFVGPEGIGKKLFARELAKTILCLDELKSCNTCSSCIKFESDNHPDFMQIDSEDGKNIKIGQIRLLQEKIAEKPIISSKKVYIINDSDLMTIEAQNCLLKTLEEPPEYATIILVLSNENKLLNTIKSRCTKISFQKLSNDNLIQYAKLNNIEVNNDLLSICNGSISSLISLNNNIESYKTLDVIIADFSKKDIVDIWNEAEILYKSKDNILNLLDYFNNTFFNKLRNSNEDKYINSIKIVETTKKRLSSNANFDMCIDNLLLKIWEEFNESNNRS